MLVLELQPEGQAADLTHPGVLQGTLQLRDTGAIFTLCTRAFQVPWGRGGRSFFTRQVHQSLQQLPREQPADHLCLEAEGAEGAVTGLCLGRTGQYRVAHFKSCCLRSQLPVSRNLDPMSFGTLTGVGPPSTLGDR